MKKLILSIMLLTSFSFANAQTKGTNTLGLGVTFGTEKTDFTDQAGNKTSNEIANRFFSLSYGNFIKDNERMGAEFTYGNARFLSGQSSVSDTKFYGGRLSYQKYYALLKKFYAFAGGSGGYNYSKGETDDMPNGRLSNTYSVGGYGGLTWFLSKRFAFETDLLAANVSYRKTKNYGPGNNNSFNSTSTNFDLTTTGAINNLGFKIYLLF